ncbi:MAG: restriction endonuclease subunit S [Ignavibacteria bacterium]
MTYRIINIRLSELATIFSGFNYNKSQFTDTKNGIPFLQGKDIPDDSLSLDNAYWLKEEFVNFRKLLVDGDILFSAKGNRNFAYMYKDSVGKAVASSTFLIIRSDNKLIIPEYLSWFLNGKIAQDYFKSESKGTFIPSINKSQLGEINIPVPPPEIQRKIITIHNLRKKEKSIIRKIESKKDFLINKILYNIINNTDE